MKIPKLVVTYDEFTSDNRIENIENLIEEKRFDDGEFDYFFEVYEDDLVVVFAFLYAFEMTERDLEEGNGRVFQVETAVLVKEPHPSHHGKIYYMGDNDGWGNISELLKNSPVWTKDELKKIGVESFQDADSGFPNRYDYEWKYSLIHQKK